MMETPLLPILSPLQQDLMNLLEKKGPMTRDEMVNEIHKPRTTIYDNLIGLMVHNKVKNIPARRMRGEDRWCFLKYRKNRCIESASLAGNELMNPKYTNPDPYAIITVDTAKLQHALATSIFIFSDGPTADLGGNVQLELGTFLDLLELNRIIKLSE